MLRAVIESSAGAFEYDQALGVNKTMVICFLYLLIHIVLVSCSYFPQ